MEPIRSSTAAFRRESNFGFFVLADPRQSGFDVREFAGRKTLDPHAGGFGFLLRELRAADGVNPYKPRRTLAVNFCCFSSFIAQLLEIISTVCPHDTRQRARTRL